MEFFCDDRQAPPLDLIPKGKIKQQVVELVAESWPHKAWLHYVQHGVHSPY